MQIHIHNENEILDGGKRKKLIEQFDQTGNQLRKHEAFKGYECLKDKTSHYVMQLLLSQFDLETVFEMQYAISNISILRKVIDKLAKVYGNGVKRTLPNEADTKAIEDLVKFLKFDPSMRKSNRYYRTFKNTLVYLRPLKVKDKYTLKVDVLPPFSYDAVENPDNPEEPIAIVISDYIPTRQTLYALDAATAGRQSGQVKQVRESSAPGLKLENSGEDTREFIWWTEHYHFTTNAKGAIINKSLNGETVEPGIDNPILEMPFVNICGEQDGCFFAEGGSDLIDAGVKINTALTNVKHIGISQGHGQLFMTGKNLPKSIKVGPNHCIQLEHETEDPVPTIGYLNANPQINELKELVIMEVALMLTTNNLSTAAVSTNLEAGRNFGSGVALIIDKAESIEDVTDQQTIFLEKEPFIWAKLSKWYEVYKSRGLLIEELAALPMPTDFTELQLTFPNVEPITSEKDELDAIKQRKDLSLNTDVELIMRDNPGMTEEQAQEKLDKIKEEKMQKAKDAQALMGSTIPADPNAPTPPNAPQPPNGKPPVPPKGNGKMPPNQMGMDMSANAQGS